jgi:hypothetical protein
VGVPHGPVGVLGIRRRDGQQALALQRSRTKWGVCAAATPTLAPTTSTPTFAPTTMVPTTLKPSGAHSTGTVLHRRSFHSSNPCRRHRHTHKHAHARQCTQTHANTYPHIHTRTRTHARTRASAHTHTHTDTEIHAHARARKCKHAHTCARAHTHGHAEIHTRTRTHARTHARTHRHPPRGSRRAFALYAAPSHTCAWHVRFMMLCSDADEHSHVCADGLDREQGPRQRERLVRAD